MSTCPSCGVDLNSDNPMNFCRCPKVLQRAKDYAMTDFELTKSIIHDCPALRLPQSFTEHLGMVAQIVALKGASPQVAQFIVDSCNSALRASTPAERVPLTDEQIKLLTRRIGLGSNAWLRLARVIEAAHGIVTKETST